MSGTPKQISKTADGGNKITSNFCGDCGTTLYREGATFGDSKVLKVGVLDDVNILNSHQPQAELYAPERISWVSKIDGAGQMTGMS